MNISRRGFLGVLFGAGVGAVAKAAVPAPLREMIPEHEVTPEQLLVAAYFPTLKVNEGEKLHFYRCSARKVTVGYGTNVETNSKALADVAVFKKGVKLSKFGKALFMRKMKKMSDEELKQYTVQRSDAVKMAWKDTVQSIKTLQKTLVGKDKESYFFNLPLCMQALALDVFYNLGPAGFRKYKKFQAALKTGNFAGAVRESRVYTNKKTKKVNVRREAYKKRSLDVMNVVRLNVALPLPQILNLVAQSHVKAAPKENPLDREVNLKAEAALAVGEYYHQQRVIAKRFPQKAVPLPEPANINTVINQNMQVILASVNPGNRIRQVRRSGVQQA